MDIEEQIYDCLDDRWTLIWFQIWTSHGVQKCNYIHFLYKTVLHSWHPFTLKPNILHHTRNKLRNHPHIHFPLPESTHIPVLKVIDWLMRPPITFLILRFSHIFWWQLLTTRWINLLHLSLTSLLSALFWSTYRDEISNYKRSKLCNRDSVLY